MNNPCVAHRGWSGRAPENTLAAFKLAADHPGISMIELDVQLSLDGKPVVIHDYTLERTAGVEGFVGNRTLNQLKELDVGKWFDPRFEGETIPTLDEVLQVLNGKKRLNIEIKRPGFAYEGLEQAVVDRIRNHDMEDQVCITSFNHESIRTIRNIAPSLSCGPLIYGTPILLDQLLKEIGGNVVSMNYFYLNESLVKSLFNQSMSLIAWTIDDPTWMKQTALLDDRIAICTNHPDRWFMNC